MVIEFNPDGSLKLPGDVCEQEQKNHVLFKEGNAIKITKDITSVKTPMKCIIVIEVSENFKDKYKIEQLFRTATGLFKHSSKLSFKTVNPNSFTIEIESGMYRCSWCENFVKFLRKQLNTRIICKECQGAFIKGKN